MSSQYQITIVDKEGYYVAGSAYYTFPQIKILYDKFIGFIPEYQVLVICRPNLNRGDCFEVDIETGLPLVE